jgi:molybdate transport system regulatory protein
MTRRASAPALEVSGSLRLAASGQPLGGHGRMALLRAVAEQGSITRAAKAVGMSYKAAWTAIDAMNRAAGRPLVLGNTGGRGGGSTTLTDLGRRLLRRHALLDELHQRFVALMAGAALDLDREFSLLQILNMKTTARNQFLGTVSALRPGAVNDEVELTLPGGARLVAIVTRDSSTALGLAMGLPAIALVPAHHVLLATGLEGAQVSARNRLPGRVLGVTAGAVNSEVTLALDGGGELHAIVTAASVAALGLAPGVCATALVKASDVILAVLA